MRENDSRHLTVSRSHLAEAPEVLRAPRAANDPSLTRNAGRRALDPLRLAWRRLEEERARLARKDIGTQVETAFEAARGDWQQTQDLLNGAPGPGGPTLEGIASRILSALAAVDTTCELTGSGDPIHSA